MVDKYKEIIKKNEIVLHENIKRSNRISLFRGLFFLLSLIFLVLYFVKRNNILLMVSLLFLLVFIIYVIIHIKYDKTVKQCINKIKICHDYINRINGDYHGSSEDTGLDFYNRDVMLKDLNIIGNDSVYQYLCVARTNKGKNLLFKSLTNEKLSTEELQRRQEAVGELGNKIEFCVDFEANSKNIRNNTYLSDVEDYKLKSVKRYLIISIIIFSLEILLLFLCGFGLLQEFFAFVGPILLDIIFVVFIKHNKKEIEKIDDCNLTFHQIKEVLKKTSNEKFKSRDLISINNKLLLGKNSIEKLINVLDWDSIRKVFLVNIILNALFPISIIILYLSEKRLEEHKVAINEGIKAYEDLECLMCLSVINRTRTDIARPTRTEEVMINAKDMKHLLVQKCVANNFSTNAKINIITGSNMSGKTSFMRTLAVNLVLMNAGAYVIASSFSACYLNIFTSMQTNDDLSKGISSFYSEILRIKKPIEFIEEKKPMIVFIDEIFHGTNSNDRIYGAKKLLEKLACKHVIVVITTHDFELCDIENIEKANYHFSEYYENDKIMFDYKIKNGKCTTTNAISLLKLAGIINNS